MLTNGAGGRVAAVSVFPQAATTVIAHSPGVSHADPLVLLPQQIAYTGESLSVNVIGAKIGGFGDPAVTAGRPISGPGQVVVDSKVGATVGSELTIGTTPFRVVGQITNRSLLGGTYVVYVSLSNAQTLGLGGRPLVTAVVTSGVPKTVPAGLQVLTTTSAEQRRWPPCPRRSRRSTTPRS